MSPKTEPTLGQLASKIYEHLRRIERNPALNSEDPTYKVTPYFSVGAQRSGSRVRVTYVSYQGSHTLTREEAVGYLAWLDGGNVGTHFTWQRTLRSPS